MLAVPRDELQYYKRAALIRKSINDTGGSPVSDDDYLGLMNKMFAPGVMMHVEVCALAANRCIQ